MPTPQELEATFWKALRADMTVMLGIDGAEDGHVRPMTAQVEGDADRGPIWFFAGMDNGIVKNLGAKRRAVAAFSSSGNDVFASIRGNLTLDNDRAVIDRLWNPFVAAWYPGGKEDPNLALLRLDPETAEIWENSSGLVAGIKMLFGADPKADYKDKVATVSLA
jgi:general stress protein 26